MKNNKYIITMLIISMCFSTASLIMSVYTYYSFYRIEQSIVQQLEDIHNTLEQIGADLNAGNDNDGSRDNR